MTRWLTLLVALPMFWACSDGLPLQGDADTTFDFGTREDAPDLGEPDRPGDVPADLPVSSFELSGGTVTGFGGVMVSNRFRLVSRITAIPNGASSDTYTLIGGVAE
jgi:hypothetical protein